MSSTDLPPLLLPRSTPPLLPGADRAPRLQGSDGGAAPTTARFHGMLADAIDQVDGLQRDVQDGMRALASGERVELHDIMLSMGKSEVAFNLMLEVRNKLVDAWDKLSRAVV